LHGGTSISWKILRVGKGLVPAAGGAGRTKMKLRSAGEGKAGFFLNLYISQILGGNQGQTSITSEDVRNNQKKRWGCFMEQLRSKRQNSSFMEIFSSIKSMRRLGKIRVLSGQLLKKLSLSAI
jgi:hypothetical protein